MENHLMAVRATQDCELKFGRNWSAEKCDVWLRGLLPAPFAYNDECCEGDDTRKSGPILLSRENKRLTVVDIRRAPTGQDLADFKSRVKAGVKDSKIIFSAPICRLAHLILADCSIPAFTKSIRPQVYEAWENRDSDSDAQHSDNEDEDEVQHSSDIESVEPHKAKSPVEETPVPRKRVDGQVHGTSGTTPTDVNGTGKRIHKRKRVESDSSSDEANGESTSLSIEAQWALMKALTDSPKKPPCKRVCKGTNLPNASQVEPCKSSCF